MSNGHRFYVQSEHVRDEGRWWYVECSVHPTCVTISTYGKESAFIGRGAEQRAERALQDILARTGQGRS